MPSLLEGQIARQIFKGFKGLLLKGTLTRKVPSGGLDKKGDPNGANTVEFSIEGFIDKYSDEFRARAGIPLQDLKVNFFAESSPGLIPSKNDRVTMGGRSFQLRKVDTDPATAMWECQAHEVK